MELHYSFFNVSIKYKSPKKLKIMAFNLCGVIKRTPILNDIISLDMGMSKCPKELVL